MRALILFAASCVLSGIYAGLQDRFGPNVIAGYRAYRKERKAWRTAIEQMSRDHQETEPPPRVDELSEQLYRRLRR